MFVWPNRATLFGSFGGSKRWLSTNADGTTRPLATLDFYKAGAMTGAIAAFTEGPIDFYKSQIQYQIIKSKTDPAYKRACPPCYACMHWIQWLRSACQFNGSWGPGAAGRGRSDAACPCLQPPTQLCRPA